MPRAHTHLSSSEQKHNESDKIARCWFRESRLSSMPPGAMHGWRATASACLGTLHSGSQDQAGKARDAVSVCACSCWSRALSVDERPRIQTGPSTAQERCSAPNNIQTCGTATSNFYAPHGSDDGRKKTASVCFDEKIIDASQKRQATPNKATCFGAGNPIASYS